MKTLKKTSLILILLIGLLWLYANSLLGVSDVSKNYLKELKIELKKQGLQPNLFVISGRRWQFDNYILRKLGTAARNSQHLKGNAIDIIILDVNNDNSINSKDVDLVYNILNKKIIVEKGGIGTYKKESGFFSQQMIHFDCRGKKARWHR